MALRRLAAAESPFRRLRLTTFDNLKGAGKAHGSALSGARDCPLRRIGVFDSALSRGAGCDSTLRRLGAVARGSWTKQQMELVLDTHRSTRWLSTRPGGVDPGSAGGGDNPGPASSAGGGDNPGPASSGGGGGEKQTFDWDNFDWAKFKEYFKIAEILRIVLKGCGYFVLGFTVCGSAVMYIVNIYVCSKVQSHVSVEREKREVFEKNATIAHQEFVFRTNSRYDNLEVQFNELMEKNMELKQHLYDSRNVIVALMGEVNMLQKQGGFPAKRSSSEVQPDGNLSSSDEDSSPK